jgi:bifunctional UDP-N-acetylglucosamine pyrophosphorylase/glucosamine-1-phosphate N-acetyltransferase
MSEGIIMSEKSAIILAAGKGTRMKSELPKVLCEVLFTPMVNWVAEACRTAGIDEICAVTGYRSELVEEALEKDVQTAHQAQQLGTGHAVLMARAFLQAHCPGDVAVLNGDAPLMDADTLERAYALHKSEGNAATVITARLQNPPEYGRILRGPDGVEAIVEHKDATEEQRKICEVNSGAYWFDTESLLAVLDELSSNNAQGEYYLTDTVGLLRGHGRRIGAYCTENTDVILGANSKKDLMQLNQIAREKIAEHWMEQGVEFLGLEGIYIGRDVTIGRGTRILPGTILRHGSVIGENCVIGPNSLVERTSIGDGTTFNSSQAYQSVIGNGVSIGPFCHIRPNSRILDGVHIGDFVEVKNSVIGEQTHISHLTYVGDSDVGKKVNFGCGVATANYDGIHKFRCVIGDNAFIGCNTNLVAPVHIGDDAYTAAGSTITDDVPDEAMGIARARQINKEGYNRKIRPKE